MVLLDEEEGEEDEEEKEERVRRLMGMESLRRF